MRVLLALLALVGCATPCPEGVEPVWRGEDEVVGGAREAQVRSWLASFRALTAVTPTCVTSVRLVDTPPEEDGAALVTGRGDDVELVIGLDALSRSTVYRELCGRAPEASSAETIAAMGTAGSGSPERDAAAAFGLRCGAGPFAFDALVDTLVAQCDAPDPRDAATRYVDGVAWASRERIEVREVPQEVASADEVLLLRTETSTVELADAGPFPLSLEVSPLAGEGAVTWYRPVLDASVPVPLGQPVDATTDVRLVASGRTEALALRSGPDPAWLAFDADTEAVTEGPPPAIAFAGRGVVADGQAVVPVRDARGPGIATLDAQGTELAWTPAPVGAGLVLGEPSRWAQVAVTDGLVNDVVGWRRFREVTWPADASRDRVLLPEVVDVAVIDGTVWGILSLPVSREGPVVVPFSVADDGAIEVGTSPCVPVERDVVLVVWDGAPHVGLVGVAPPVDGETQSLVRVGLRRIVR